MTEDATVTKTSYTKGRKVARVMRHLSWKQAWLRLAEAFAGPTHDDCGNRCVYVVPGESGSAGLCDGIADLRSGGLITEATRDLMVDAVYPGHGGFRWSVSPAGHRARVRFCRKQAELPRPRTPR